MKRKLSKGFGTALIILGLALVVIALGMTISNLHEDREAGELAMADLPELEEAIREAAAEAPSVNGETPLYELYPDMEMPVITIKKTAYVAEMLIPSQDIDLPVAAEFSMAALAKAPCRYEGSLYQNDLVICGHNYRTHFQKIRYLEPGDSVILVDMDGHEFPYLVSRIETLGAYEYARMTEAEDWDLTLFTCTFDSRSRVTVRCIRDPGDGPEIKYVD